jgi:hypothetical protein
MIVFFVRHRRNGVCFAGPMRFGGKPGLSRRCRLGENAGKSEAEGNAVQDICGADRDGARRDLDFGATSRRGGMRCR